MDFTISRLLALQKGDILDASLKMISANAWSSSSNEHFFSPCIKKWLYKCAWQSILLKRRMMKARALTERTQAREFCAMSMKRYDSSIWYISPVVLKKTDIYIYYYKWIYYIRTYKYWRYERGWENKKYINNCKMSVEWLLYTCGVMLRSNLKANV